METDAPCPRAKREMDLWDRLPKAWREAFAEYPTCFRSSDYVRAMQMCGGDMGLLRDVLRAMDPWVPEDEA